jgi:hypothetical protein
LHALHPKNDAIDGVGGRVKRWVVVILVGGYTGWFLGDELGFV